MAKEIVAILALLTSLLMVMSSTKEKNWPDFSCHPSFNDSHSSGPVYIHKFIWNQCQEREATTKMCAKLCVLRRQNMLYEWTKTKPDDPLIFDIDSMVNHLANENGYKQGLGGVEATKLMNKVREGMEGCKQKYGEVLGWKLNSTCDKWNPFLTCIDTVYGC